MSDKISLDQFKTKVASGDDQTLTAMYNMLVAVGSPIVAAAASPTTTAPVTEAPAANDPATTAPAAETPAAPEVKYRTVAGTINDYNNAEWDHGAWKKDQRAGVSIRASAENRAAFKVGAQVQFKNGEFRKITEVHDNDGSNLSIWMDGAQIPGDMGAPYAISTKVVDADVPAPQLDVAVPDNLVSAPAAQPTGKWRTGNKLNFDMQLMGINLAGAEFGGTFPGTMGREFTYPGQDSFQKWRNEGCEFVRYPVKWERLQRNLYGDLSAPDMAELDKAYAAAEKLGMWIMLDIHNYMRRYINGTAYLIGSQQVPTAAYVDFIVRLAKWLKGKKAHFGLDIMNEPYPLQPSWSAIAEAACKGYRTVDTDTFLVVEGTMWANAHGWESKNPGFPLKGIEGIIYQAHCYCDSNAGGLFGNRGEQIAANAGTNRQNDFINWGKKHNVPLLVGEYSSPYNMPTAQRAMEEQIKQLNANNILHTFWAAGPWWTQGAANGVETGGQMREPISILRKYWKEGKRTRVLGPNA